MQVILYGQNGERRYANLHVLVLQAFVGPAPDGMECRHLDGNARNNALSNLCWGTPVENAGDRARHGTVPLGDLHPNAKLTSVAVKAIKRQLAAKVPHKQIAHANGVSVAAISAIASGRNWRAA